MRFQTLEEAIERNERLEAENEKQGFQIKSFWERIKIHRRTEARLLRELACQDRELRDLRSALKDLFETNKRLGKDQLGELRMAIERKERALDEGES
jgi:hypothetical protein